MRTWQLRTVCPPSGVGGGLGGRHENGKYCANVEVYTSKSKPVKFHDNIGAENCIALVAVPLFSSSPIERQNARAKAFGTVKKRRY